MGLHHWGVIDGKIKTNLSTQDEHIRTETKKQIKRTIDIGADIGCAYVNAHPGAQAIETIDFTNWKQDMLPGGMASVEDAAKFLLESAQELTEYADSKQVLLTLESLTARESIINHDRNAIYDAGNTTLANLEKVANAGAWFANDISHTGSHFLLSEESPTAAWNALIEFSGRMASRTRLVHMNVITPPYNGTDSHDGITDTDFEQETFPDKDGARTFLELFKGRNDIYIVNEPKEYHGENYLALVELAKGL